MELYWGLSRGEYYFGAFLDEQQYQDFAKEFVYRISQSPFRDEHLSFLNKYKSQYTEIKEPPYAALYSRKFEAFGQGRKYYFLIGEAKYSIWRFGAWTDPDEPQEFVEQVLQAIQGGATKDGLHPDRKEQVKALFLKYREWSGSLKVPEALEQVLISFIRDLNYRHIHWRVDSFNVQVPEDNPGDEEFLGLRENKNRIKIRIR